MTPQYKYKVALLGCPHIHVPDYLALLKERQDAELVAIYDHDARRAEEIAEPLEIPVRSLESILESDIHAVLILSETNRHADLIEGALKAKKHLFVEKPLSVSVEEARRLAQSISKEEVIFHAGYFLRELPAHTFVHDQLQRSTLGRITRARASFSHAGALKGWFGAYPWMLDTSQAGFGGFGDLGAHALDLLTWLLGDAHVLGAEIQSLGQPFDTHGEGLLSFGDGIIGTVAASWVDEAGGMTLEVHGTKGSMRVEDGRLETQLNSAEVLEVAPSAKLGLEVFLDALADPSADRRAALVSPSEAAKNVALLEALYASASRNR